MPRKNCYKLSQKIASGGMAEVYIGKAFEEDDSERIVAIKRILPNLAENMEFIRMFQDEARFGQMLKHENIVQIFDFQEVEGAFAIIMELVVGADIKEILIACHQKNMRLDTAMVLFIITEAAKGLHYAHLKKDIVSSEPMNIVHRDISPQNLLIGFDGSVKVTDFGIAKGENKQNETAAGVLKGKYSYMSPEQVSSKNLDGRADVFSLSVVLWECLAQKRLFDGKELDIIRKVQKGEITKDLQVINPKVDDELLSIVLKGLTREPKDRYQSADELKEALLSYLNKYYPEFNQSELSEFVKDLHREKLAKFREYVATAEELEAVFSNSDSSTQLVESGFGGKITSGIGLFDQVRQNDIGTGQPRNLLELDRQSYPSTSIGLKSIPLKKGMPIATSISASKSLQASRLSPVYKSANRKKKTRTPWLLSLLLVLALSYLGALLYAEEQIPKAYVPKTASLMAVKLRSLYSDKFHIFISVKPKKVSIRIDGRSIKKGQKFKSPLKLNFKPGRHTVELIATGYVTKVLKIKGKKGERKAMNRVVLKKIGRKRAPKRTRKP
ncbi:MAG: hypothetical protein CMP10_06640 [Zetaproteobacteria bacterium]|nr:hypothetical protein [Pseudobdellovibrionaceae bacterium]